MPRKQESKMRREVVQLLRARGAVAVENPIVPGTPDVNYVEGWIELKCLAKWPKRATTVVRIPHFTPQQRVWMFKRSKAGGAVFLLLKVGYDWLLFDAKAAIESVGRVTRSELLSLAIKTWNEKPHDLAGWV